MAKRNYDNWSKEELVREVEKLEKKLKKSYGLVWEDKLEDVATLCKEKLPILEEDTKKEIKTDDDQPVNILIEGDNYHALSVLNYTHKGRIDVIYIDPPYNTGNDTFMYNDKIVDKEDPYKHSKWLAFMSRRLKLAKNLLSSTGVIFMSIDKNEFAQLKLLCDEIFGENNYLGNLIWKKRGGIGSFSERNLTENHEYAVVYRKRYEGFLYHNIVGQKRRGEFKFKDGRGLFRWMGLLGPSQQTKERRPNLNYGIIYDEKNEKIVGFETVDKKKDYFDKTHSDKLVSIWVDGEATWLIGKDIMEKYYKQGLIAVFKEKKGHQVRIKNYLFDKEGNINGTILKSILSDNDAVVGMNTEGTKQIRDIFHSSKYDDMKPKPVSLIKLLVSVRSDKDSTILDFFAGTGTTAHAVMELNKEDGGNRKFILCTNNENNICTEVCYPRIEKVIKGYRNWEGDKIEGLGGSLKYFKADFVDAKPTDRNKKKLVDKSTEMLCLKEDCFDEVGKGSDFKIFKNGQDKYLGIIYDDTGIDPFKKEVRHMKKKLVVYVFSLDESAREEEFEDMSDMVQLKPIPAVILNVYKRIFK